MRSEYLEIIAKLAQADVVVSLFGNYIYLEVVLRECFAG